MEKIPVHEIEIKLRVPDPAQLLRRLRALGATPRGRVFEQNVLFDTPDGDFRRLGRLLRLRVETPAPGPPGGGLCRTRPAHGPRRAVLTSKAPPSRNASRRIPLRYKIRLERELPVREPARLVRSLRSNGLLPSFRYEKFRTRFRLKNLHLDLDETPIGTFLELEGHPRAIDRAARLLGYGPRDYIRRTYWDLYAAACRRRGLRPRHLLFLPRKNFFKTPLFP